MNSTDITTVVAIWGALTGTSAIIWDVIKWRRDGPRLRVAVTANMQIYNKYLGITQERQFIQVHVTNRGTRSAKVSHLVVCPFRSRLHRAVGRQAPFTLVTQTPPESQPLPVVLQPGDTWTGLLDQQEVLSHAGRFRIYLGVTHTLQDKPILTALNHKKIRAPYKGKETNSS